MLKYFKDIRQKLLIEKRFSRYLAYAIGEIILVVIGILIALQINNWNERRKIQIVELEYLESLYTDLIADSLYLNRSILECKNVINSSYQSIHQAYEEQKSSEDYIHLVDLMSHRTENLVIHNSTFIELYSAGKLGVFKNKVLKDSLISLHRNYDYVASRIKEFNDYHSRFLASIKVYARKYSKDRSVIFNKPYMFSKTEWEYINDPTSQDFKDLEWANTMYLVKHSEAMEFHKTLLIKVKILVELIEKELEHRK